jgi:hypothetical protein
MPPLPLSDIGKKWPDKARNSTYVLLLPFDPDSNPNIIRATTLESEARVREDLYLMMAVFDENIVSN